jgi:hypothetical protein
MIERGLSSSDSGSIGHALAVAENHADRLPAYVVKPLDSAHQIASRHAYGDART